MRTLQIDQLRPTQYTHGMREVRDKIAQYGSLSGHELDMAIAEKPIPVVLGPDGMPFAIDHHHVAAALWHVGVRSAPGLLVKDLSSLSASDFWLTLDNQHWTHPYDRDGKRVSFGDMPQHVWEISDDEFRSLAAAVRDAGGYAKSDVPLAEFRWSAFFRSRLSRPADDAQFASLVEEAVRLARTTAALGLPGYIGPAG